MTKKEIIINIVRDSSLNLIDFDKAADKILNLFNVRLSLHPCKYVKRDGESCSLNNNCKYPNCN